MASEYIAPLNLKYILINTFAGTQAVFMGIFFIMLGVLGGLFRMPDRIFLVMVALAGVMLYGWFGGGVYLLVLILVGIVVSYGISRIVKG